MAVLTDCGGLHIRTASTDANLLPNTITQLIVVNGLRIGVIPQSTVTSSFYKIIIKNSSNEIILLSKSIQYIGVGNYIYVIIPFEFIPTASDVITIRLISDKDCSTTTDYKILPYVLPNSETNVTTMLVNGVLEKYIKIKPTISTGGFTADNTYYFKCDSVNQTDDDCFIKFKKQKDLSKILDKLPSKNVKICPPVLSWTFTDMICISPFIQPLPTKCEVQCSTLLNTSGSTYRVAYVQENVKSFKWTVYNSTNVSIKSEIIVPTKGYDVFDANFGTLGEGTYTLELSPIGCTTTAVIGIKYFSINGTNTTVQPVLNIVPDMVLTSEVNWNDFTPDKIPNVTIPTRLDAITNKYVPNKWLFYHSYQGLSKFGTSASDQLTKLFKKGFTHIASDSLPAYETNLENFVTGDKIIGDIRTLVNDGTLLDFKNYVTSSYTFAEKYKITKTDNKYDLFINFIDYQGRLLATSPQESANYFVTGLYSGLEKTNGRFGYTHLSYDTSGGYITSDTYSRGNLLSFTSYSDNTVENDYKNKSLTDSPKLLICSEQNYYYETVLPQGYQIVDNSNTNWFTLNHFGGEATNTVGVGQLPNCEHWASQIAGNVQNLYNRAKAFNQEVIMSVRPTCDRGDAYLHSESLSIYRNGKYIKESGRYRNTLYDVTSAKPYISDLGTEVIPNFIAEGQIILAYFAGARGVSFVNSYLTKELVARSKTDNLKKGTTYDNPTVGNQDYESYNYTMKAMWRLSQKVTVLPNVAYSFFDICDGTEIYLNIDTEVSYDGGVNYLKQRALDWQINQKSPILAVVNLDKNVIAICGLQAYGAEQDSATIRYNKNNRKFQQIISIPIGKTSIYMFDLGQII